MSGLSEIALESNGFIERVAYDAMMAERDRYRQALEVVRYLIVRKAIAGGTLDAILSECDRALFGKDRP